MRIQSWQLIESNRNAYLAGPNGTLVPLAFDADATGHQQITDDHRAKGHNLALYLSHCDGTGARFGGSTALAAVAAQHGITVLQH